MGMHDKPKFLTGRDGWINVGEEFFLHNAKLAGTSRVNGQDRPTAKLLVSRTPDGKREIVFTSGAGIVRQIREVDQDDYRTMQNGGMHLRLDERASREGNPVKVLTPASDPPPSDTPDDFGSATSATDNF